MSWLKSVVVDIVASVAIAVVVFAEGGWVSAVRWFVIVYTPLMLLLKVLALSVGPTGMKRTGGKKAATDEAPPAFFHVVYGLNVVLLGYARWWIMAAAWAAIWLLSVFYERKVRGR